MEGSLNRRENGQRGPRERRKRELSLEEIGFLNTTNRKRNGGIKKKNRNHYKPGRNAGLSVIGVL